MADNQENSKHTMADNQENSKQTMADNEFDCPICNNQLNGSETAPRGHVFCRVCSQHRVSSGDTLCSVCNTPLVHPSTIDHGLGDPSQHLVQHQIDSKFSGGAGLPIFLRPILDRFYILTGAGVAAAAVGALGVGVVYFADRAATKAAERVAEAAQRAATEAAERVAEAAQRAAVEAAARAAEAAQRATMTGAGMGAAATVVGSVVIPAIFGAICG